MADKKGGKSASPDDIMAPAAMKPILTTAKGGAPASCALGLTKQKEGVLLLDKRKKPKGLLAELKKQAAAIGLELELPSLRFGQAKVDTDTDAGLLTFVVNKDSGGTTQHKMLERVKKAGFTKVEIIVDTTLENEEEEDGPAAPAAADAAAEPAPPDLGAAPEPQAEPASAPEAQAEPEAAAPPAPEPAAGGQDATALTRTLTDLVRQMIPAIATDPTQGNALKSLATQAQTGLKSGDLAGAASAIEALRQALDSAGVQPGEVPAPGAPVNTAAFGKARMAWVAARKKVEGEIGKLHAEMTSVYKDHGFGPNLDQYFHKTVEPVLGSLDESLAHKLDEVTSNTDPAQHAQLVREAKQIMQGYQAYLAGDPLIAKLDANPFVPLAIERTLTATLSTLAKVIA
jgi:hypothetical protein